MATTTPFTSDAPVAEVSSALLFSTLFCTAVSADSASSSCASPALKSSPGSVLSSVVASGASVVSGVSVISGVSITSGVSAGFSGVPVFLLNCLYCQYYLFDPLLSPAAVQSFPLHH